MVKKKIVMLALTAVLLLTTVDILYRRLCGSAYFSCQLWRLRLKISRAGA